MYKKLVAALGLALCAPFEHTCAALIVPRPPTHPSLSQTPISPVSSNGQGKSLENMLEALSAMQDTYFEMYVGTWPTAIDWTAAVMGTHVSATLSSLISGLDTQDNKEKATCMDILEWDNMINKYHGQTSVFYYAENAFSLRTQAFDDMLWVVLGWLENIKFGQLYTAKRWSRVADTRLSWYGLQMTPGAAHRARIFYEMAEQGWDTILCGGGMTWNPALEPYKNAITNELFAAASISMYLYYPGDNNTSPFAADLPGEGSGFRHDPSYLENAIKAYKWIKASGLQSQEGLYQDGWHITGWAKYRNGTINPGTKICDDLNQMVYTYNQGVMLTASRGLWLATGAQSYLDDGHLLIESVMKATGWGGIDKYWHGLGREGVMEEFCDRGGYCSQDGQTFKGIFFSHMTEFCRPLWPQEEEYVNLKFRAADFDRDVYELHLARCASYGPWVKHNGEAVMKTKDREGLFGMWWGISPDFHWDADELDDSSQQLPTGADDYRNPSASSSNYTKQDLNNRGRGRTVETQSGGLAVLRAVWQWESCLA